MRVIFLLNTLFASFRPPRLHNDPCPIVLNIAHDDEKPSIVNVVATIEYGRCKPWPVIIFVVIKVIPEPI